MLSFFFDEGFLYCAEAFLVWCNLFLFLLFFPLPLTQIHKTLLSPLSMTLSMFPSSNFKVLSLAISFFIHFELIFVYGVRQWSSFILLHVAVQFSQHNLLKRLSFLHCMFFAPLSQIVYIYMLAYFQALNSVPLIYVPFFVPVSYCFDYYSFVIWFEIREFYTSSFVLLSQGCFCYSGLFVAPYKFQNYLFLFQEIWHWNFNRDCIKSVG